MYVYSYLPKPTVKVTLLLQVMVDSSSIRHRKVVPLFFDVAGTVRLDQTTPDMSVHSCVSQIIRALISLSFWCFSSTYHLRSTLLHCKKIFYKPEAYTIVIRSVFKLEELKCNLNKLVYSCYKPTRIL